MNLSQEQRAVLKAAVLADAAFADLVGVDWNVPTYDGMEDYVDSNGNPAQRPKRVYLNPRDDDVASWLNGDSGEVRPRPNTFVNARQLMAKLGAISGAAILEVFATVAQQANSVGYALKWAMPFITGSEGIDVGNTETRQMLDALVAANALTSEQAAAVKALAERPATRAEVLLNTDVDTLSAADVSVIMRGA